MKQYAQLIENLAKNQEKMIYVNSGPEHAAIVFSNIFKYSNSTVSILAGNMNGGISKSSIYLEQLKRFLDRKGNLQLLLSEYNYNNNPELFTLLSKFQFFNPQQVDVRVTEQKFYNIETQNQVHFCTADKRMYRLEEDIDKFTAKGSFNDPDVAGSLNNIYKDVFDNATSVSLVN